MNDLEKFNNLVNDYGLDEKETKLDDEGNPWFTAEFLAELMGVNPMTIRNNVNEIFDWEILDKTLNLRIFEKKSKELRGRNKYYYSLDILTQLGMTLRSENAREFQKQIRFIVKGLVNGDLKLNSTKNLFVAIANKKTTHYRKKISQKQLVSGVPEHNVYTRIYNAKLNTELRKRLSKKEMSGYIPEVLRIIGKTAYGVDPSEFREIHGIENPHHTREHCSHDQNRVIQFLEEELYKRVSCHEGKLSKRQLFKYVDDCIQKGETYSELVNGGITLHMSPIKSKQEKLDDFI